MIEVFKRSASDPWIVWGSFAGGFLFAPLFLLFLVLAVVRGWAALKREYAPVTRHWYNAGRQGAKRLVEALPREGAPVGLASC